MGPSSSGSVEPSLRSLAQDVRLDDARTAVEALLAAYPGFTLQTAYVELRKWNFSADVIERYMEGLRKAGVPEEPRE